MKNKQKNKNSRMKWVITITILAFVISFIFSFVSEMVLKNSTLAVGIIILFIFILIGVLFDMIGVAVTASDEKPIHSMNARKVKGAKVASTLKKNADKVSSFCNDVIGDICGIISGSAGVVISASLTKITSINALFVTLLVTALVASLTIGGKALGKGLAIKKSNDILYGFSRFISYFYHPKAK